MADTTAIGTDWANATADQTWADVNTTTTQTDWTTNTDGQTSSNQTDWTKAKDDWASMRYQISRAKEEAKQYKAELEKMRQAMNEKKPEFNQETDPDGSKEIEYRAQQIAKAEIERTLKEAWINETLQKIQYEKEMDEFTRHVDSVASETLGKFWIKLSRDEVVSTMQQLDEKGISPLQIALLAKAQDVISKMKPDAIVPWEWAKANAWDRALTQDEINANIYKQFWVFGYK